ncbi:MAG TPA: protein kinase [Gemmatimonadales bacterium]|nr:protein kinase [Gemmatimonadales bacterium]
MPEPPVALVDALGDRYAIERELGRGGMATVYLVRDLKHDRQVALKVLAPELGALLGRERFLREIRTAAQLQHPHILPVFDSGEAAGLLWYTMPYVEGESLRDLLRRKGKLEVSEAVRLGQDIAGALQAAHDHGVIHRDVKPENVLLSHGEALVGDFGIARTARASSGDQLTQTGLSLGTPAYMSPEQGVGERDLDGRSDIYALGCLLYELLAGRPPYTGPTPGALLLQHAGEPIPPLRRARPDVPGSLEAVVAKAMAKDPAERFATADALRQALASGASAGPPALAATALRRRLAAPARLLVPAVLGALVLVVAFIYLAPKPTPTRNLVAVLPFDNLGDPADQYFADGLTDEITSRLASVSGLGVISRTSAARYRGSGKTVKQIGQELGAAYILEGSVRWDKAPGRNSRIRVTPELISTADDSHLWADRYDAEFADVFDVQSRIAEQVTTALGITLGPAERRALATRPTTNLSAYDAFLRGGAAMPSDFAIGGPRIVSGLERAAAYYTQAVQLDSSFALAYATLGWTRLFLAFYQIAPAENLRVAEAAIGRALALAPDLGSAHAAAGYYQLLIARDTGQALREFDRALESRPNDADLLTAIAAAERPIRGPRGRALAYAERALVLNPNSTFAGLILAEIYLDLGRFGAAEQLYDRIIDRDPTSTGPYVMKALVYLLRDGDTVGARAVVRGAAARVDSLAVITAALTAPRISSPAAYAMLDPPYRHAWLTLRPSAFGDDTALYAVTMAYAYRMRGDSAAARAYYDTAERVARRRLRAYPLNPSPLTVLMWTEAAQGRANTAAAMLDRMLSAKRIGYFPERHAWLARIALLARNRTSALDELETHGWGTDVTVPWLCVDRFWDPIRGEARFQQLTNSRCPAKDPRD